MSRKRKRPPDNPANPNDVLLASVTIAMAISKGRSKYEIETLINLSNMITYNLQAYLRQIAINNDCASDLDLDIDI